MSGVIRWLDSSVLGIVGAVLAWLAWIVPAFLVVPIAAMLDRRAQASWVRGAAAGVMVGSAALMLATAIEVADTTLDTPIAWVRSLVALAVLISGRLPSFAVVGLAGLLRSSFA
jgi:chromate transport protein ChrA